MDHNATKAPDDQDQRLISENVAQETSKTPNDHEAVKTLSNGVDIDKSAQWHELSAEQPDCQKMEDEIKQESVQDGEESDSKGAADPSASFEESNIDAPADDTRRVRARSYDRRYESSDSSPDYYQPQRRRRVREFGNVPDDILNYALHLHAVEKKIDALTNRIGDLESANKPNEALSSRAQSRTARGKSPVEIILRPSFKWAELEMFRIRRMTLAEDQAAKASAAEDVLTCLERSHDYDEGRKYAFARPGRSVIEVVVEDKQVATTETHASQPLRVRIFSKLLIELLEEITGVELGDTYQITFLRPFKLFVTFESQIRAWAGKLAEKLKSAPEHLDEAHPSMSFIGADINSASHAVEIKKEDETRAKKEDEKTHLETEDALKWIQLLIELFDTFMKPVFDVHQQIKAGTLHSIAFPDLWHLFKFGEEIQASDESPQIYRVLNIVGGRSLFTRKPRGRTTRYGRHEDDVIIIRRGDEDEEVETAYRKDDLAKPFVIHAFCHDFNGREFGAVDHNFSISPYEGERAITGLQCYPVRFARDAGNFSEQRQKLVEKGRRFLELARADSVTHKRYANLTLDEIKEEVDSEIIIDFSMALLKKPEWEPRFGVEQPAKPNSRETKEILHPDCDVTGCCINEHIHDDNALDSQQRTQFIAEKGPRSEPFSYSDIMTEDELILCPSRVYGFVLRSRKWATFDINFVEDLDHQESSFDRLVLPEGHKDTLLALVKTHAQGTKPAEGSGAKGVRVEHGHDLVRGKGKGLIILLHGEPGVGKTSTAECIAEYTRRPLFAVTCGDIGQTPKDVEDSLENHFQLAHKWGCVLLLDEADVFLLKRSKGDLQRNAIVSVFLRVLEYYSGILFLTTNRIGTFDPAFRSRIHMSLFYPRLSIKATETIWRKHLEHNQNRFRGKIILEDKDIEEIITFVKQHYNSLEKLGTTWNGRQIRNAFQTAIAIAQYEAQKVEEEYGLSPNLAKPRLKKSHFEKVAEASSHFDKYLREVWGGNTEDLAREGGERRDDLGYADHDFQNQKWQ